MTFVRRASIPVLALLALATVLDGVAFAQRIEACAMVRKPSAERKGCCALAGMERITSEGGDCCKTLQLADTEDALSSPMAIEVAPAAVALMPSPVVAAPRQQLVLTSPVRARAPPPPLWRPTDTVRLLL